MISTTTTTGLARQAERGVCLAERRPTPTAHRWPESQFLAVFFLFAVMTASGFSDDEKYGVRWKLIEDEVVDYDLPCERLDAAKQMCSEDFDRVFPWSEIKRCKVIPRADGSTRVSYEGEADFGDANLRGQIMVEFPKHYAKREVRDGKESRWISRTKLPGFYVDPAFVEDGRELDHVYVGAYEAFIAKDGKTLPSHRG